MDNAEAAICGVQFGLDKLENFPSLLILISSLAALHCPFIHLHLPVPSGSIANEEGVALGLL